MINSPKLGQPFRFNKYEKFSVEGGVVNKHDIRSAFFVLKTTLICKEEDDYLRHLKKLHYDVRFYLNKFNNSGLFQKRFISTPSMYDSFQTTGRSFTQFEYTLFTEKKATFKEVQKEIREFVEKINNQVFLTNESFEFINNNWILTRQKQLKNVKGVKNKQLKENFLWEEETSGTKII
jgi:hypothetical protein